jgi:ADP-ribosylglycohydrolase
MDITTPLPRRAASGCLFGLAIGDSLAAPVEFIRSVEEIRGTYGGHGPMEPEGHPARVTDDTQMALAVGEALAEAGAPYSARVLERPLRRAFVAWMRSPDNTRAPGMTCINACRNLASGQPWQQATIARSKGCGANMRVAPVGLLPGVDEAERAGMAQFQAGMTHGHSTALAAADLTAWTVADLAGGGEPATLPERLRTYAASQLHVYHNDWLGSLWQATGERSRDEYIVVGWSQCFKVLERLEAAVAFGDREVDPCQLTGEGWIAEEAFATGLLCFLLFPDDPVAAVRRAALTSGDSDSIACLTGAFAGAYHGLAAWPEDWVARIEYRERLARLGELWD